MDLKKIGISMAAFLVLLWVMGRLVSNSRHEGAATVAASAMDQPAPDKWHVNEGRSPMDDSKTVSLSLDSEDVIQGPVGPYRPTLVIRCKESKVDVYVVTGMAASVESDFDGGPRDTHSVRIRLDQGSPTAGDWNESTDQKALFVSDLIYDENGRIAAISGGAAAFAQQLVSARTLTFEFTPFDANPAVARFDLYGLETHFTKVTDACPSSSP